jgi:hypothetical protein
MKYYVNNNNKSINPMSRLNISDTERDIISKAPNPNNLSRYHGGYNRENHVYISGYWYFLILPPDRLFHNSKGNSNSDQATNWMHSTAEAFTPPTRSLKKIEAAGMGGMKSYYVAGQEINREFTVTFKEYQELPIMNILQNWTAVIDPNTGVSPLSGTEYIPKNYKGVAFVALCKPTIGIRGGPDYSSESNDPLTKLTTEDIEQLFFFDGVVPKSLPYDSFNTDISNNDGLTLSVAFSFDGYPLLKDSPNVIDNFLSIVSGTAVSTTNGTNYNITDTYEHYRSGIDKSRSADSRAGTDSLGVAA